MDKNKKLLESYLITSDNPYVVLGLDQDCSLKSIQKKFTEINRILEEQGGPNDAELLKIVNAYNILSNEDLRDLYDNYYYKEIQKKKVSDEAKNIGLELFTFNLSVPFTIISKRVHSYRHMVNPIHVIKSLQFGGFLGIYKKVLGVSCLMYPVELGRQYLTQRLIENTINDGGKENDSSRLMVISFDLLSKTLITFPTQLILDCIAIAPSGISAWKIFKHGILRIEEHNGLNVTDGSGSKIQLKYLYYALIYQVSLLVANKIAKIGIRNLADWVKEQHSRQPNNQLYYYLNKFLQSSIGRALLISILTNPLEVIRLQYPSLIMTSHIDKSTIVPLPINPISMAISIFKDNNNRHSNGLLKFYNGFTPYFISRILIEKALKYYSNVFEYESHNFYNTY